MHYLKHSPKVNASFMITQLSCTFEHTTFPRPFVSMAFSI